MKLCFVAKDEPEFVRYFNGLTPIGGIGLLDDNFSTNRETLRKLAGHGFYKDGWVSRCAVDDRTQDLSVYVMLAKSGSKDTIRDRLTVLDDDEVSQQAIRFLGSVESCMRMRGNDDEETSFDENTFVFIHWGGGDPTSYEELFQPFCDEHPDNAKGLRAFALSSRRRELFDVTAAKIVLPQTEADALKLVDKFSFARVRNLMTEYVVNHYGGKLCGSTPPPFEISDRRFHKPLQFFIESQVKRLEHRSRRSDAEQLRLDALKKVLEIFDGYKNDDKTTLQLPYREDTVELFAALLKGGDHVC